MSPRAIQEKLHITILREPNTCSWYRATVLAAATRVPGYWIYEAGVPVMRENRRSAEANENRTERCLKPPYKAE